MRWRNIGVAVMLLAGLFYFAWAKWHYHPVNVLAPFPATTARLAEPLKALALVTPAPHSATVAGFSSALADRMRNTYQRQHCRDWLPESLTTQQRQFVCQQDYEALFDNLLPKAEAGDLNALGFLAAISVSCQLQLSLPRRDFNQDATKRYQFIQKKTGTVPAEVAEALPEQTALANGETTRAACTSIEQRSTYVLALVQTRENELTGMTAPPSPFDAILALESAALGKRSMSAEEINQLRGQLLPHQRHAFAMSVIRCKLGACSLPVSEEDARRWLQAAVEHGDYEALSFWREQLAQDPARTAEAYAWNLFSRDLLQAGCYPFWFPTEAAYNFGELEQLGQNLSAPAQSEARQLAQQLIANFGQQARQNLACD